MGKSGWHAPKPVLPWMEDAPCAYAAHVDWVPDVHTPTENSARAAVRVLGLPAPRHLPHTRTHRPGARHLGAEPPTSNDAT